MTQTQQPEAQRFTKKPVTITAIQWFKSGDHPAVRDISDSDDLYFTGMGGSTLVEREKFGVIGTLESPNHLVTPGDWIITGVQGEHYPCKPDIFEATYAPEMKLQPEAAPVQMPEPVGWFHRHPEECKNGEVYNFQITLADKKDGWEESPLYTEQQVRSLLAELDAPDVTALVKALERVKLTDDEVRNHALHGSAYWDNAVTACISAVINAHRKGEES